MSGLKRKRKMFDRSLCSAHEKTAKLTSPQSASTRSEVFFTNGNILSKRKQFIQLQSVEKKRYAASPKLFLPIVFGRSACQTECAQGKETEHLSCFGVSFMYTICMKEDFVVVVVIIANSQCSVILSEKLVLLVDRCGLYEESNLYLLA